ncbi:MAG: DUF6444 domain-containing protein, partial [Syntrophobacteraceae bacterium]|nr:DUF6444 domain-containing protein [Syntrophobacteraceae bacterium]
MPSEIPNIDAIPDRTLTHEEWEKTPASVQALVFQLLKRIEDLEARLNQDSSNSSRPPSSDSPYKKG